MITFVPLREEGREPLITTFGGYLHGKCFIFALAVSRGTGEQLVAVETHSGIVHAGVRTAGGMCKDIRGTMDERSFAEPFVSGDHVVRQTSEEELLRVSLAANGEPIREDVIERARIHAESAWPTWPWKESHLQNVLQFAEELSLLCKKHGVWLREMYPATPPIIYKSDGEMEDFIIEQLPSPNSEYVLRRGTR
jgi:hypothetical protein